MDTVYFNGQKHDGSGLNVGKHAVVDGNTIIRNIPDKMIYVSEGSDLEQIADEPAGTMAATYGFKSMWQYDGNMTWVCITGGEDIEVPSIETIPPEETSDEPTYGG